MPRPSRLAVAAATVLLLTSCAAPSAGTPPTDVRAPTDSAPPAAVLDAVPVAPGEQPPLAFAGDCDNLVTDAEIDALVGADVPALPSATAGGVSSVDVLGGLACAWGGLDYAYSVVLTVIPAAGFEERIDAEFSYPGGSQCQGHPATPVELPEGTWDPVDCAALADGVAEERSTEGPAFASGPTSAGYLGPGPIGAEAFVGFARCIWSDASGFTTDLTPGGGWAVARLTERRRLNHRRAGLQSLVVRTNAYRVGLLSEFLHGGILDLRRDDVASRRPHQPVALTLHDDTHVVGRQLRERLPQARDDLLQRPGLSYRFHGSSVRYTCG